MLKRKKMILLAGVLMMSGCSTMSEKLPGTIVNHCPPVAADIKAEAKRVTTLPKSRDAARDFAGKLVISEITKNRALERQIKAYEGCRTGGM